MSSSYMLERELLGSSRAIIDAHSNSTLVSPPQYPNLRSPYGPSPYVVNAPTDNYEPRKALADLQNQILLMKQDIEKKDHLIQELTSIKDAGKHVHFDANRYDSLTGQERAALDAARREIEQYRIKVDGLSHDLHETKIKLTAKDERINELRREIDSLKNENEVSIQMNNQLRIRVRELETNVNSYDSVANKSSLTISSLQKDCKEKQDQLFELQSRIRVHMEEREANERKTGNLMNRLQELFVQLGVTLGTEFGQLHSSAFDKLINRVADINGENTLLKGKVIKLEEANKTLETESQANRATLQQMTNQLTSFDQSHHNHRYQLDAIRAERDAALNDKETIKRELEIVKSRLDSVQKAWQNTRDELDQRETKFSSNELTYKQIQNELNYSKSCFEAFKQQIAQLLSDGYVKVEPKEEEVKEKIQLLMQSSKDRGLIITNLQNQKEQLSKQIQDQIERNKELESKYRHAETHLNELEQKVKTLDNNYTTTEVYRENLKQDKVKFLHFLERLASIMKIENISNELGYEYNPDVILSRAEQLMKLETNSIVDQKTSIYSLQRRIKQLKEQMEQKDLHLDLLRKKVIVLEEGKTSKSELEKEVDDHVNLSRKMKMKLENLTQQLNDLKKENSTLKSQLTDVQTLKGRLVERENDIRRLLEDLNKLENVRDRQASKISSLQEKIHSVDDDANRSLLSSDNAVRTLSNELRFLKTTLEKVTEREQRLIDFRALIARMLGLDAKTLSVPDFEIISRLERLLSVLQPSMSVPVVPVTRPNVPIRQPQVQQQHHYHHPIHSAQGRRRSPSPRRTDGNHRTRSLSPRQVGIDPRTY